VSSSSTPHEHDPAAAKPAAASTPPPAQTPEEKRRMLAELLRKKAAGPRTYPLSFAQQRVWFLEQLEPGNLAYNVPLAVLLLGPLDVGALERALDETARRHATLRTRLAVVDGEPVQVVEPSLPPVKLEVEDRQDVPDDELESAAQALSAEVLREPFDLGTAPLWRVRLFRQRPERALLSFSMHHAVMDGWSQKLFMRDLARQYQALVRGEPSAAPAPALQYPDFAVWQRKHLSGAELERQLAFWTGMLGDAPRLLALPTDRPRPAVQGHEGSQVVHRVGNDTRGALQALGRQENATLFMTWLAATALFLSRAAGQEMVVLGTPVAGRTRPELEEVIGFFANTLALRVDLSGDPTFRELLRRVRGDTLMAFSYQELPFERLVDELKVPRRLDQQPLYQAMYTAYSAQPAAPGAESEDGESLTVEGLSFHPIGADAVAAVADLNLVAMEYPSELLLRVEYRTELFDAGTVARMAAQIDRMAFQAASHPDVPLSRLALAPDEDLRLVAAWNDATRREDYRRDVCIHQLFEAQAARTPDAAALVFGEERVTYAELDARANRLARHLRSLGVGPDVLVGVCMERTPEMIVALFAVLKAGGAYVPVDPAYPAERIGYVLEDAGAPVVLSQSWLEDALPATDARVVFVDAEWPEIEALDPSPLPCVASPANLAYAIYTSGSTGRPKGVAIEHRNTVIVLQWLRDSVSDEERASVLGSTSISFDVSIAEIFGTLCWGGTLVLVENALSLAELPAGTEVVYASMVPSAAAELLRMGAIPPSVRTLNLGGEALPNELAQGLYALGTVEKVGNLYGPTEDTTYSTYSLVEKGGPKVYVGHPVANTQAYVLDAHLQPVPVGVPGELYLAGDGVTRGYLNRPGLTAERYIPNPFGPAGSRMYRVGDLVRFMGDGRIDYLGRLDHQVKIRGFRIELGEIESAARERAEVREAVVVARDDGTRGRRLVAYVVPADGAAVDVAELRTHLRARLPDYMVPSAVVVLDELPHTPNGKVDRLNLPAPEAAQGDAGRFVEPRTATERALAAVWREVLKVERVGVHDHFFDLGGHSLLATQVVSRIREQMGTEVALRTLFEAPVLGQLAARIDGASDGAEAEEAAPPLVPVPRQGPIPLSFAQERLWFVDRLLPGTSAYNIPLVVPFPAGAGEGAATLERALGALVARHEALRTTFREEGGVPVQVIHPAGGFRLEVADVPGEGDAAAAAAWARVGEEVNRPFDLETGPLFRATLVRAAGTEPVLVLVMHHIVSDGWSMDVVTRELETLYAAFSRGEPSPLPELEIQYADFAVWQRGWLRGRTLERQVEWWKERLAGAPPVLELPTDRPRPPVQGFAGAAERVALPRRLAVRLRELARGEGATLFMALLAGWNALMARWSAQDDVVVGVPVAGRNRAETEGLIGFFVNNLVIRTTLAGDPTFRELLGQVRETLLGAYAHQDVPFERLVEELNVERSLGHSPLFQVTFNLQNTPGADLAGGETDADDGEERDLPPPAHVESVKYDLSVNFAEDALGLLGGVEYSTDLFERDTVLRMMRHFRALLEAAAASPDTPLSRLPLVGGEERRTLVEEWSRGEDAPAAEGTLHRLFAEQAARTPDAVAVAFGAAGTTTYAELDARSDRLARHLRALGVTAEVPVALLVERSPEMVVALLAVLKAGGACVPLDPADPRGRWAQRLAASGAAVLLTQAHRVAELPPHGARTVVLDGADAEADGPAFHDHTGPDGLAWVVPAGTHGVAVSHRAAAAVARGRAAAFGITAESRIAQLATPGSGAALAEIVAALLAGACLVMAPEEELVPGAGLEEVLYHRRATVAALSPAVLAAVVFTGFPALATVVVEAGGCTAEQAREWSRGRRLVAAYGPPETAGWAALSAGETGARAAPGPPGRRGARPRSGRPPPARPGGGAGGGLRGRGHAGAGLRRRGGAHRRALRPRSLLGRGGGAPLPHRHPGALDGRGRAGAAAPRRRGGHHPGSARGAGRGGGGGADPPRRARGDGGGAPGGSRRPAAGGLRGPGRGRARPHGGRAAGARRGGAPRAGGPLRLGDAGLAPPRPRRPGGRARPPRAGRGRRVRGAAHRDGAAGGRHLGRGAGRPARGCRGPLLRAGRALSAGHAGDLAHPRVDGGGPPAADHLRGIHGGGAGGAGGRGPRAGRWGTRGRDHGDPPPGAAGPAGPELIRNDGDEKGPVPAAGAGDSTGRGCRPGTGAAAGSSPGPRTETE
jgi:amino acid adenylation domain-containing protein